MDTLLLVDALHQIPHQSKGRPGGKLPQQLHLIGGEILALVHHHMANGQLFHPADEAAQGNQRGQVLQLGLPLFQVGQGCVLHALRLAAAQIQPVHRGQGDVRPQLGVLLQVGRGPLVHLPQALVPAFQQPGGPGAALRPVGQARQQGIQPLLGHGLQLALHLIGGGFQAAAEVFLHFVHARLEGKGRQLLEENGFQLRLAEQNHIAEGPPGLGQHFLLPPGHEVLDGYLEGQGTLPPQHRAHRRPFPGGGLELVLQPGHSPHLGQLLAQQALAQALEGGLHHPLHAQVRQHLGDIVQE